MSAPLGAAEHPGSKESIYTNIPMLQSQATMLMPGMRHARSLLDTAISVLEYFERHAASDASDDRLTVQSRADPALAEEAERMVAMLSAFRRLA